MRTDMVETRLTGDGSQLPLSGRWGQIRKATLEAFYRRGYHGASLRSIAEAVGIKVPSLYNYITSKQDLLYQLMRSVMEDLIAETNQAVAEALASPPERLRAAIRSFVLFNAHHPHEASVSDTEMNSLTFGNRQEIVKLRKQYEGTFKQLIADGVATGDFVANDLRVITNSILSVCARLYFWYRPDGPHPPDVVADLISDYLLQGLLVRGAGDVAAARERSAG